MILCRVTGDCVSTVKNEKLRGHRQLIVQPVDVDCTSPQGDSFLAIDLVQAGVSDLVLVLKEGGGVRIVFDDPKIPLAAVVLAVVDDLHVADEAALEGGSTLEAARAAAANATEGEA